METHPAVDSAGPAAASSGGLWLRWVLANLAGELAGLGLAGVVGLAVGVAVERLAGSLAPLATAALMVAGGTFEGFTVGLAQWLVIRCPLPLLLRRRWVVATVAGAFIAWVLGALPSTLMSMGGEGGTTAEPSPAVVYSLAVGLGAVAGAILGGPQSMALRRHVARAGW